MKKTILFVWCALLSLVGYSQTQIMPTLKEAYDSLRSFAQAKLMVAQPDVANAILDRNNSIVHLDASITDPLGIDSASGKVVMHPGYVAQTSSACLGARWIQTVYVYYTKAPSKLAMYSLAKNYLHYVHRGKELPLSDQAEYIRISHEIDVLSGLAKAQ